MRHDTCNYRELFLQNVALMDVRAPVEFGKGAFPSACNLPLMNDTERHKVGVCYKHSGQNAAVALGHRLVCGQNRAERLAAWIRFAHAHPGGYLYCFRGGLRSRTVQQWLKAEAGIVYPRVEGGYKAMRGFLLGVTARAAQDCEFVVVGGMTGTGKTEVLRELANSIDLEAHAHHRGSSFGRHVGPQPVQINFENSVAIDLLKKRAAGHEQFVLEDEGRFIGSCNLSLELYLRMQHCPMVWLEDALDHRVQRIVRDYVVDLRAEFVAAYGEETGFILFAERLRQSLAKLVKRLGSERHQRLTTQLNAALAEQARTGDVAAHHHWIITLLSEYYDPMYQHQRRFKSSRVVFCGPRSAVIEYLQAKALH